ncbi:P-II family nitrogen regulator, partial [bacterium NHP-B]
MSGQMYKVEIVTRPTNFEKLKTELAKIGVTSITFYNVHGCGLQ